MTATLADSPIPLIPAMADNDLRAAARNWPLARLMATAAELRDCGHPGVISYSRKVFIPLTKLCRDVCHYCTFAERPSAERAPYLSPEDVLAIARAGHSASCHEALFTLGDKPELRYSAAQRWLKEHGFASTIDYLAHVSDLVFRETGLFPHANPGVMTAEDIARLRMVTVSQGLMLETAAERLSERGGPHFGSPDKHPAERLETIRIAGEARVPFTSGILIGIGETRDERIDALLALRDLHARHGHIQEIIVQNFRAKPGTRMATAPDADFDGLLWTIGVARLLFGPAMHIQAPPNLSYDRFPELIAAGLDDWGGISPVTPDHVNPEAAWPALSKLAAATEANGKTLVERLPSYPEYVTAAQVGRWHDTRFVAPILQASEASGFARGDAWSPGQANGDSIDIQIPHSVTSPDSAIKRISDRAMAGHRLDQRDVVRLFAARGRELSHVLAAADELRASVNGDTVTYVVNRNINYTNICKYQCRFCAFSKGTTKALRGKPYDLDIDEIVRRSEEAWARGATEVCLQGGIHPVYTGATYLAICRALHKALPDLHIHAFSPLEIAQGAATLGVLASEFLTELKAAGLGTLPGTAAEILDDEVRATLCPDKLTTAEWLAVIEAAHNVGLRTTATIMFGHIDEPRHWARHLLAIRDLQERTRGFTEMVPLPFVHMEAPMYLRGKARKGPTWRETLLVHAVSRLMLHPLIPNIQASWVKLGPNGVAAALSAGVNDLGGTLMNESISRAAGTTHGEELPPEAMETLIRCTGRIPRQRTTLYEAAPGKQAARSFGAPPLSPRVEPPPRRGAPSRMAGKRLAEPPAPVEAAE
jgi:FO synthase